LRNEQGAGFLLNPEVKKPFRNFSGASTLNARVSMMNVEYLKEQVDQCRRLARQADPFTEKRLLALATEYEARITLLKKGFRPSVASRLLKSAEPDRP
jgi:hypothetical protein